MNIQLLAQHICDGTLPPAPVEGDMTPRNVDGQVVCAGDLAFVLNARLALARAPHFSAQRVRDFRVFVIPDAWHHSDTISGMSVRALWDTLEGLLWVVDGNVHSTVARSPEWFNELRELRELIRHRAYYLCETPLDADSHDVLEYREVPKVCPVEIRGEDSDSDGDFIPLPIITDVVTQSNEAFVHDFNSMLWHLDEIMSQRNSLTFAPPVALSLKHVRTKIIAAQRDNIPALVGFRRQFEYDLACNEADRRVFYRRQPNRKADSRTILLNKRLNLVNEELIPKTVEAFFNKHEITLYRLNTDAAFAFWCKEEGIALSKLPIFRIRANGTYGYTNKQGLTTESDTLIGAYLACVEDREEKFIIVPSDIRGFPAKRIKLMIF